MDKTQPTPAEAISLLNNYHESVIHLVLLVEIAINKNLIGEAILPMIKESNAKVKNYFDGQDK